MPPQLPQWRASPSSVALRWEHRLGGGVQAQGAPTTWGSCGWTRPGAHDRWRGASSGQRRSRLWARRWVALPGRPAPNLLRGGRLSARLGDRGAPLSPRAPCVLGRISPGEPTPHLNVRLSFTCPCVPHGDSSRRVGWGGNKVFPSWSGRGRAWAGPSGHRLRGWTVPAAARGLCSRWVPAPAPAEGCPCPPSPTRSPVAVPSPASRAHRPGVSAPPAPGSLQSPAAPGSLRGRPGLIPAWERLGGSAGPRGRPRRGPWAPQLSQPAGGPDSGSRNAGKGKDPAAGGGAGAAHQPRQSRLGPPGRLFFLSPFAFSPLSPRRGQSGRGGAMPGPE